jgi:hypothetical protein
MDLIGEHHEADKSNLGATLRNSGFGAAWLWKAIEVDRIVGDIETAVQEAVRVVKAVA